MAFRGRAMVELKTDLGQLPEIPVEDIGSEDVLKVQVTLHKHTYTINCDFHGYLQ